MPSKPEPQLRFDFARPKKKRGGLEIDRYEELLGRLRADAERVAERFKLPAFELDADRPDSRTRYGICHSDGRIRVRLVNVRTGQMLKYSAMIDTVVHELAHLRYMNHGPRWESLYERMLAWARAHDIYEPRPVASSAMTESKPIEPPKLPEQIPLFSRHGRQKR